MAMRHLVSVFLLALPSVLAAQQPNCGISSRHVPSPGDSLAPIERLLAIVGDRFILCSEIWPQYYLKLQNDRRSVPDSATMVKELREIIDGVIDSELLVYIALKQDIDIPADEIEQTTDRLLAENRARYQGNEAEFMKSLRGAGFGSVESFRLYYAELLRRNNLPDKLLIELSRTGKLPAAAVPDSVIESRLPEIRAARGKKLARISFRQMFLPTQPGPLAELAAKARADSFLVRLQKGEDFETLAKAVSDDDSTRALGGDLNWQPRGRFYPDFERWAFSATPGQLSPVIRTPSGYHVARVDRVQAAQVRVRQILVRPAIDSTDAARNLAQADSIVKALRAGASFDSLADKHGDPTLKSQRTIPGYVRDSLPADYQGAFKDLKVGEYTAPFRIPDPRRSDMTTYVVAMVTGIEPEGEYTDAELREMLRRSMQNTSAIRAYIDRMKKAVYIKIFI